MTQNNVLHLFNRLESITTPPTESELAEIIQLRTDITPLLIEELRQLSTSPTLLMEKPNTYIRHILSIYLLAYFKEDQALPLVSNLVRHPGDLVLNSTGEVLSEALGRILASLYTNDLTPITDIIEDSKSNPWMRSGAIDGLMVLWEEALISRECILHYLKPLIGNTLERTPSYVWDSIALLAYDIHPEGLENELIQAINDQLIEPVVLNKRSLKTRLQEPVQEKLTEKASREASGFIKSPSDELTWWLYPNTEALNKGAEFASVSVPMVDTKVTPGERLPPTGWRTNTVKNTPKKIGRNAPCPCGSGLKHKKCCG